MAGIQPIFVLVFIVAPLVLLAVLAFFKPHRLPWAALFSFLINLLVYGSDLLYEESRVPMLCLFLVQAATVLVLALALQAIVPQHRQKPKKDE